MIKKLLVLTFFILYATVIFSQDIKDIDATPLMEQIEIKPVTLSPFSLYKPNFVIFGNSDDQVKVQFSIQYELLKKSGVFMAWSQTMFWKLYKKSSPFAEINFNPELFWKYGNNYNFFQIGIYEHKSNGKEGPTSRGWDRSYGEFQGSIGKNFNGGFDFKAFYTWHKADENKDINDYIGFYETKLFVRFLKSSHFSITDKEELYFRGGTGIGHGGFDFKKGWVEAGLKFRLMFRDIQPHFFIQGFYGYGESLVDYNVKDMALRAGFVF